MSEDNSTRILLRFFGARGEVHHRLENWQSTVGSLKNFIHHKYEVEPHQQRLVLEDTLLDDESTILKDCSIVSVITVKDMAPQWIQAKAAEMNYRAHSRICREVWHESNSVEEDCVVSIQVVSTSGTQLEYIVTRLDTSLDDIKHGILEACGHEHDGDEGHVYIFWGPDVIQKAQEELLHYDLRECCRVQEFSPEATPREFTLFAMLVFNSDRRAPGSWSETACVAKARTHGNSMCRSET